MLIFVLYLCIDIFSLYRNFRSLRQLERVAEQSEDLDNLRIFHYCVELMIGYKKKTSKQIGKNINYIACLATVVGKISYEDKMDMSILMQKNS